MEDYETHRWRLDKFSIELKTGSQVRLGGGAAGVPIMSATTTIAFPAPLPFKFLVELSRLADGNMKTGDIDFDGELSVRTSDEAAAMRILASPELRLELRELFQSGRSLPTASAALDQARVSVQTFDKKAVRAAIELALSVARRVSAA